MLRTGIDTYKLVFGTAASNPVQLNGLEAQLMWVSTSAENDSWYV